MDDIILVKYLAIGRLVKGSDGQFKANKHQIIASFLCNKDDPNAQNYKKYSQAIMNKRGHKLESGKLIRLTADNNDYELHLMADVLEEDNDKTIVFFAMTDPEFTKNFTIVKFFQEFKEGLYNRCSSSEIAVAKSGGAVSKKTTPLFQSLTQKYGSSKLQTVSTKVEEVKDIIRHNVEVAIENVNKLDEIEAKSEELEQQGKNSIKAPLKYDDSCSADTTS